MVDGGRERGVVGKGRERGGTDGWFVGVVEMRMGIAIGMGIGGRGMVSTRVE